MKVLICGTLAISLCGLAGCGATGSGGSSESVLSIAAAAGTASEATAIATSMTQAQVTTSGGAPDVAEVKSESTPACASVNVVSSGSDGWTDEILTFTAPPCQFTGSRGYDTLDVTGALELTRNNGDGYNFTSNATNLEWAFTTGSATYSETRNGTRAITASPSGASAVSNISVVYAGAAHSGTLQHTMTSAFTPAAGLSLEKGSPLPSGNFVHTGTVTWTGSDGHAGTFGITTTTPLAYDSTCTDTQPSVFDSGEIHVHLDTDTGNAYARVVWANCEAPTITFVAD